MHSFTLKIETFPQTLDDNGSVGQWVMGHGSNESTNLGRLRGSRVTRYQLTHD